MPHAISKWVMVATFAAASMATGAASANGRFPGANQLVVRGEEAALMTSFGVIASSDSFATTRWTCESALGYNPGTNNDPGIALFPDLALAVSGSVGLTVSHDQGCTNPAVTSDHWMADVSVDVGRSTGLALVRGPVAQDTCTADVWETLDSGRTWTSKGSSFPPGFCALTIDSAPSRPERVYVTGNTVDSDGLMLTGALLVSNDRGRTFEAHPIPNQARPFIGAVDPIDPDVVYVRTSNPPNGGDLLVTTDAGNAFRTIAHGTGVPLQWFGITGIAVSPDGAKVAFGSINEGLFVLDRGGSSPEKRSSMPVTCLTWTTAGLYACSQPSLCGPFAVGRSTDEGRSFVPLLRSFDVKGDQTTCAPGSSTAMRCPSEWSTVRDRIDECADGGANDKPDTGVGPDGGDLPDGGELTFTTGSCNATGSAPWSFLLVAGLATLVPLTRRLRRGRR